MQEQGEIVQDNSKVITKELSALFDVNNLIKVNID